VNATPPYSPGTTSVHKPSLSYRVALAALLIGALLLALTGVRLLVAGAADYQAQSFIDDWQSDAKAPNDRAWSVAKDAADRALAFYPGRNGGYYDRLGQINEWRVADSPYGDEAAQPARQAALEAYRRAIEARPDWPHGWLQLALLKLRMQAFDAEFDQALRESFERGPWRIEINSRLAEIGLQAWPQLDAAQRRQTLESARRTVRFSDETAWGMFALARELGQLDRLCPALPEELRTERGICIPVQE